MEAIKSPFFVRIFQYNKKIKIMKEEIQLVIEILNILEIDGETMQHVIENTGMQDQMLRQLIMSAPIDQVQELITEKINLTKY
jgi:hypothetical protein